MKIRRMNCKRSGVCNLGQKSLSVAMVVENTWTIEEERKSIRLL